MYFRSHFPALTKSRLRLGRQRGRDLFLTSHYPPVYSYTTARTTGINDHGVLYLDRTQSPVFSTAACHWDKVVRSGDRWSVEVGDRRRSSEDYQHQDAAESQANC